MEQSDQTGVVIDIASDGKGIVRQEGLVTFIPFTAQGDVVHYHTTQKKKNYALGSLLQVLKPGQERISPLCPYYGVCGGCQLQHIAYQKQLEHKRRWVEDALKRIGKFTKLSVPPVVPTSLQWGYRRRIHLVLRKKAQGFQAGYIAIDNTSLVPIESCPIFVELQDPILQAIQEICRELQSPHHADGKVTLLKSEAGYIAHFHFKTMPINAARVLADGLQRYLAIKGIIATSARQSLQFGVVHTSCEIDQLSFDMTSRTFIQNHPEQSINIYKKVVEVAAASQPKRVLDLYCGIGISSLLLALHLSGAVENSNSLMKNDQENQLGKSAISQNGTIQLEDITGVELNPEAIKQATENAQRNGISRVKFIAADVEKVLPSLLENKSPDFIIVNPPREGLSPAVIQQLKSSAASTLVYISCMPATLARDLYLLCQQDYHLASIEAFDMFPQTIHVETCVVLRRVGTHYS